MGSTDEDITRAMNLCEREAYSDEPLVALHCLRVQITSGARLCDEGHDSEGRRYIPAMFVREMGAHRVWLASYGMDRTEVTVGAFDRCVRAGACDTALVALATPQLGGATQPIVGVSWEQARAYCHWVGGRLPTEAEWERAARGHDGRTFPWGSVWDPRRANHGSLDPTQIRLSATGCSDATDGFAFTAPVGSYPDGASPDGLLDMAGNAWEWVSDFFHEADSHVWHESASRYPESSAPVQIAPTGANHGAGHVIRGGGYDFPAFALRSTFRWRAGSGERSLSVGFRCAYDAR
jgi:formylglycine-generating enzyme required for sulfatase activity